MFGSLDDVVGRKDVADAADDEAGPGRHIDALANVQGIRREEAEVLAACSSPSDVRARDDGHDHGTLASRDVSEHRWTDGTSRGLGDALRDTHEGWRRDEDRREPK